MDRIDKFLNRRKQKNKKTVKLHNKYYEISKEDIKIVRKYKKNLCLDETVDMYIPYNLNFSRETCKEPIYESNKYKANEKREQKNFIKKNKNRFVERKKKEVNTICDVWEDEGFESIKEYKQEILLDIKDSYNTGVEELKLDKHKLEKELRKIFLKQYQPRELKETRVSDILKEPPKKDDLRPYPEAISKYYSLLGPCKFVINNNFSKFVKYYENVLEVFEFRNHVLVFRIEVQEKIHKVLFNEKGDIVFSTEDKFHIIDHLVLNSEEKEADSSPESLHLRKSSKLFEFKNIQLSFTCMNGVTKKTIRIIESENKIKDFDIRNNLIVCISNRNILLLDVDTYNSKRVYKVENEVPLGIQFHRSNMYCVIGTSSSIIIYDIINKNVISNCKTFNYVVGFSVSNFIYAINNLKRIIVFDYERNIVLSNMLQEHDGIEIDKHHRLNLLAVSTKYELLVFYADAMSNQYVLVNRFKGRHVSLRFHSTLSWIYAICNDRIVLYT